MPAVRRKKIKKIQLYINILSIFAQDLGSEEEGTRNCSLFYLYETGRWRL